MAMAGTEKTARIMVATRARGQPWSWASVALAVVLVAAAMLVEPVAVPAAWVVGAVAAFAAVRTVMVAMVPGAAVAQEAVVREAARS